MNKITNIFIQLMGLQHTERWNIHCTRSHWSRLNKWLVYLKRHYRYNKRICLCTVYFWNLTLWPWSKNVVQPTLFLSYYKRLEIPLLHVWQYKKIQISPNTKRNAMNMVYKCNISQSISQISSACLEAHTLLRTGQTCSVTGPSGMLILSKAKQLISSRRFNFF